METRHIKRLSYAIGAVVWIFVVGLTIAFLSGRIAF